MPSQIFTFQHRVTYSEITLGNHVYYSRYLDYLEAARGAFFRELGRSFREWQELDMIFPVVEVHLAYKAPARYDDEISIRLWLSELAGVRLTFVSRIFRGEKLLVEATTRHVCTGLSEKPKKIPAELVALLEPWLDRVKV